MTVGDTHVFPGFLTPVLTQLYFQIHQILRRKDSSSQPGIELTTTRS